MKMHISLFYAVIATGVVNSSKDFTESNAQLRSLKDSKGGGNKGGKSDKKATKINGSKKDKKGGSGKGGKSDKKAKSLLDAKKASKKLKEQKTSKATKECDYFSNGKSKKGKVTQKRRVGRVLHRLRVGKVGKVGKAGKLGKVWKAGKAGKLGKVGKFGKKSKEILHRQRVERVRRVGKKPKATSGTSCDPSLDLSNNWGQKPGSYVAIISHEYVFTCIQPSRLSAGASLESVPCTYDKSDTFEIDKYGRLRTSDRSLCVTADDGSLVLGNCNERTPNSIFLYNEKTKIISLFVDPNQVISLQDGKLFLMAQLLGREGKNKGIFQKWIVALKTGFVPSSNPTAFSAPTLLPTLSHAPSSS